MLYNYYRRITESLPQAFKKQYLIQFLMMYMVVLFIFLVYFAVLTYFQFLSARDNYNRVVAEFDYWEDVVRRHPNFPDAYYNAALYAGMLNQKERSTALIDRALTLDPEFKEALELGQLIVNSE